ncbi:MAG: glycosyltransferase family 2 protein [Candidatus Dormibacter sp.]
MPIRTLVIIPAFNEEESLPAVLATLRTGAPEFDVLVVDDGSTDRTSEVATAAGVQLARLPFNLGIGGALRTGFRFAVRNGYDRAIQFDADGQHDVAELDTLLAEVGRGADLVVGTRFASTDPTYRPGLIRGGAMNVLRLAMSILSGRHFSDTSSGFRAFSRPMLVYFAHTYPVEYMDSVEALLLACYAGFTVVERPVVMHERSGGSPSSRNLKLVYHYLRLLVVLVAMASLRQRRGARAV